MFVTLSAFLKIYLIMSSTTIEEVALSRKLDMWITIRPGALLFFVDLRATSIYFDVISSIRLIPFFGISGIYIYILA